MYKFLTYLINLCIKLIFMMGKKNDKRIKRCNFTVISINDAKLKLLYLSKIKVFSTLI